MFQTQIIKKQLHFKQPAGTSRGVYTTRDVWYILLTGTDSRHSIMLRQPPLWRG